jgi:hypothetical protein
MTPTKIFKFIHNLNQIITFKLFKLIIQKQIHCTHKFMDNQMHNKFPNCKLFITM